MLRHPPTRRRGHTGSGGGVLCLAPAPDHPHLLASGGEDGAVCLHDLRTPGTDPPAVRVAVDEAGDGVAALAWDGGAASLFAATGRAVVRLDARVAASSPLSLLGEAAHPPPTIHTALDDVGGLAVLAPGVLAIADDSGRVVTVSGLSTASTRPPRVSTLPPPAHTNLASCVVARPARPEEVVSGGFDCTVARWDVAGKRLVNRWEAGAGASTSGGAPTQLLNPPFVHALAAGVDAATPRPLSGLVAAALGDGSLLLLDVEARPASAAGPRPGERAVRARPAAGQPTPGVLGTLTAGGHTRAATALAFSPSPALPWLVSGGDDGRLIAWDWRRGVSARSSGWAGVAAESSSGDDSDRPAVLASVAHGRKVQAVAVCEGVVVVGDTGRGVWVYGVGRV